MSDFAEIQNYQLYLTKMAKTFFDKAWFMSHLPENIDTIIDFGCADGSFLKFLEINCPSYDYIGIDNNSKMQELTRNKGFSCFSSLEEADKYKCIFPENTCIVLNSVIHELYSYQNENALKNVYSFHPKYIAIRDMMYNPIDKTRFYLPLNDYKRIINVFQEKCFHQWEQFYENWKNQNDEVQVTHFLLKYIYDNENWEREVKENYLPIDINEIRKLFCYNKIDPTGNYQIEFQTFYKLPYLVNRWKKDFELDKNPALNEFIRNINTHFKLLLTCNN